MLHGSACLYSRGIRFIRHPTRACSSTASRRSRRFSDIRLALAAADAPAVGRIRMQVQLASSHSILDGEG